jgi:hypothetical protein
MKANARLGIEFLDRGDRAVGQIARNPLTPQAVMPDVRLVQLRQFPPMGCGIKFWEIPLSWAVGTEKVTIFGGEAGERNLAVIKSKAASEGSGKGSAKYRKWRDIRGIGGTGLLLSC